MCFNNGFVIEVLLFPKQFLIVLGLVSVTPEVQPLLRRKTEYLQLFDSKLIKRLEFVKKTDFCLFLPLYKQKYSTLQYLPSNCES